MCPGCDRWVVSNTISAVDKGSNINQWFLDKFPGVLSAIDEYLHNVWRPTYEEWGCTGNTSHMRLKEGRLFPPVRAIYRAQVTGRRHSASVTIVVKEVLQRIGVDGPRAHAHAFRKGVVTELLRAGNPINTVSAFVHHKNTSITEKAYDKRKSEELLEKMVLPIGWEAMIEDTAAVMDDVEQHGVDAASCTTPSIDRERLRYITTSFGLIRELRRVRAKLQIAESLLSPNATERYHDACRQKDIDEPVLPTDDPVS